MRSLPGSINSLAGNIPPALLIDLVKHGIWSASHALTYALQLPYVEQRPDRCLAIAALLPLFRRI